MTRRFTFLAAFVVVASFATNAQASLLSQGLGSLSKPTGANATITTNGNTTTVSFTNQLFGNFEEGVPLFLADPMVTPPSSVKFTLNATSTNAPIGGGIFQEGFSGTFSIVNSADPTDVVLSGQFTGASLTAGESSASLVGGFTFDGTGSNYFRTDLLDLSFGITLSGLNPSPATLGGTQVYTSSNISGTFSAAIPEPATIAMAGLGIFALPLAVRAARRRRVTLDN